MHLVPHAVPDGRACAVNFRKWRKLSNPPNHTKGDRRFPPGSSGHRCRVRKAAAISIISAVSVLVPAGNGAATNGLPDVLCKKPSKPGEVKPTDRGVYSYRPHVCVLEYFDAPAPQPVFVPILAMKWKRWETSSAYGTGEHSIEWVNFVTGARGHTREPVDVTLSRPRSICGHEVFTAGRLFFPYGPFDEPTELDRVPVLGRGCAVGGGPDR